jgi:hypothetical protein
MIDPANRAQAQRLYEIAVRRLQRQPFGQSLLRGISVFHSTCDAQYDAGAVRGCAQLMAASPSQPIGTIQTAIGSVTVIRDGTC